MVRTAHSLSIPLGTRKRTQDHAAEERSPHQPIWAPVEPAQILPGLAGMPASVLRGLGLDQARRRFGTRLLRLSPETRLAQFDGASILAADGSARPVRVLDALLALHPLGHASLLLSIEDAPAGSSDAESSRDLPGTRGTVGPGRRLPELAAALAQDADLDPAGPPVLTPEPTGGFARGFPQALAHGERRLLESLAVGLVDGLDMLLDCAGQDHQPTARAALRSTIADATRALQAHEPAPGQGAAVILDHARIEAGVPALRTALRSRLADARAVLDEADRAAAELASRRAAESLRRAREDEERRWKHEQALLRERDLAREARWREERAQAEISDREKRGFETMIVRIGAFAVPFTVLGGLFGMNVSLPPVGFWAVIGLAAAISLVILFLPPLTSDRRPAEPPTPPPAADARPRRRPTPPG